MLDAGIEAPGAECAGTEAIGVGFCAGTVVLGVVDCKIGACAFCSEVVAMLDIKRLQPFRMGNCWHEWVQMSFDKHHDTPIKLIPHVMSVWRSSGTRLSCGAFPAGTAANSVEILELV